MAIYYILLFISALLFSSQFLCMNVFQKKFGTGLKTTLLMTTLAFSVVSIFFFVKGCIAFNEFHFGFSWFTLLVAIGVAITNAATILFGLKVLKIGSMSLYSMFMMVGSVVLPSFTGIIFYKESAGPIKIIAIVLMVVAVVLSANGISKESMNKKAIFYYVLCLVLNGLVGVFFTIHQNNPSLTAGAIASADGYNVDNDLFMVWYAIGTAGISAIVLLVYSFITKKNETVPKLVIAKSAILVLLLVPVIYGLCNGLGDYFMAIATQPHILGSSITFPIVDGGTILFSTLISCFALKEKMTLIKGISLTLVIVSCCMLMFA